MRKYFLSSMGVVVSVVGYFLLLDFVRPILEEHHSVPVWWAILGLYLIFVGGTGFWYVGKERPGFAAIGFLLIGRVARTQCGETNLDALPSVLEGGAFDFDLPPGSAHGIIRHSNRLMA